MKQYTFSLANSTDVPEIMDLYRSLLGTPGCTWSLEYPSRDIVEADIAGGALYVLKDRNNRIVAVAAAGPTDELEHLPWTPKNPCELARIGVIPVLHRQGVGTVMLRNVIDAMRRKGFDGMRFLVSKENSAALAMYEKNGFARCGETFMYGLDFYCYEMSFAEGGR